MAKYPFCMPRCQTFYSILLDPVNSTYVESPFWATVQLLACAICASQGVIKMVCIFYPLGKLYFECWSATYSIPDFGRYRRVTTYCIGAGPCCTPQLQEEISQLSFQTLHGVSEIFRQTDVFWWFSEGVIQMLEKKVSGDYLNWGEWDTNGRQNFQEQFPHLISDLQAVCLQTVSISNRKLVSLIYEVQHSHILQVEASDPASVAPLMVYMGYKEPFDRVFEILFTKYPKYQRLEFTGQHYTTVAEYFVTCFLDLP